MMDSPKELFSRRLNELCDEAGVPAKGNGRQQTLAKIFGVTQGAVRKWLEAEGVPEYERCFQIANHFNVMFEWLMMGRGIKRKNEGLLVEDPMDLRLLETFHQMKEPDRATYIRMGSALAEPAPKENSQ